MTNHWLPVISYISEAHTLVRGWNNFTILSEEDCNTLLRKNWKWGPSSLTLKPRSVDFDPAKEFVVVMQV
jgi:hypothetical protein